MADIRIVNEGQNGGSPIAANVRRLLRANALVVVQVNASGDIINPGGAGGSGGDGAILDGDNSSIKASVKSTGGAKPLHVIITNVSGDTPNLPSSVPDGSVLDGANPSIKASVNQYVRSNPQTVVLVNASGDAYNANQVAVAVNKWNLTPSQDSVNVDGGRIGVSGDVSTVPKTGEIWPVAQRSPMAMAISGDGGIRATVRNYARGNPIAVVLTNASGDSYNASGGSSSGGDGAINDGSNDTIKATVKDYANANPLAVVLVNVSGDVYNAGGGAGGPSSNVNIDQVGGTTTDVNVGNAGNGTLRVVLASDQPTVPVSGSLTATFPPVMNVQILGGSSGGRVAISGDQIGISNKIGAHIASGLIGISGDVSTVPGAGTWPVSIAGTVNTREQAKIGTHQAGGLTGVTGDVSTVPAANQTWPVSIAGTVNTREQGKIGTHVASGLIGVTGDRSITDGADQTIKATVRDYGNANPQAVVLVNASGDDYSPVPKNPVILRVAGRLNSAGSNSIISAVAGRRIKVVAYELQGDGDNSRGFFASGASGSQLTTEWELASREGTNQAVPGLGGGYLFATTAGAALSFESSSSRAMKYAVSYHAEDAT